MEKANFFKFGNFQKQKIEDDYNNLSIMEQEPISPIASGNRSQQHLITFKNLGQNNRNSTQQTNSVHKNKVNKKKKSPKMSIAEQLKLDQGINHRDCDLNEMIRITKLKNVAKQFRQKATINNINRKPVYYNPFQYQEQINTQLFENYTFQIPNKINIAIYIIKTIFLLNYLFFIPLIFLYSQIASAEILKYYKIVAIFMIMHDFSEILSKKFSKDLHNSLNIAKYKIFFRNKKINLIINLSILFSTILSLVVTQTFFSSLLFLGFCLNLSKYKDQIKFLEDSFLTVNHISKYWNLFKVVLLNLFICHLLSCILILITKFNPSNNWMMSEQIHLMPWYQQYIWGYYFGVTIILTVGFGDLHASNSIEALFVIFISFFSCLFFSYNINYIGNTINSIKQQTIEKDNKLQVLNSLTHNSQVSKSTYDQIAKYIQQQAKIKQRSNYNLQKQLLKQLPQTLRQSFLEEVNQKLFNNITKIIPFSKKIISKLSLKIQTKICHPDQMIKRSTDEKNLIILQSGVIGLVAKSSYPKKLRSLIIESIMNTNKSQSRVICADILSNQNIKYDIKSLDYSIIYDLSKSQFEEVLKQSKHDYQKYRELVDKFKKYTGQFQMFKCKFCDKQFHTLFQCSKFHYCPLYSLIPLKYKGNDNCKQKRMKYNRKKITFHNQIMMNIICEKNIGDISSDKSLSIQQFSRSQEIFNTNIRKLNTSGTERNRKSCQRPSKNNCFATLNAPISIATLNILKQMKQDIKTLKGSPNSFIFDLWNNEDSDIAENYKNYFPTFNSNRIRQKYIKNTILSMVTSLRRFKK